MSDPEPGTRYIDVLFELPDGRQVCITISHEGRYRYMERADSDHGTGWSPPVEGWVIK